MHLTICCNHEIITNFVVPQILVRGTNVSTCSKVWGENDQNLKVTQKKKAKSMRPRKISRFSEQILHYGILDQRARLIQIPFCAITLTFFWWIMIYLLWKRFMMLLTYLYIYIYIHLFPPISQTTCPKPYTSSC